MKKHLFQIAIAVSILINYRISKAQTTLAGTAHLHFTIDSTDFKKHFSLQYNKTTINQYGVSVVTSMKVKLCAPTKVELNVSNGIIYVDTWSLGKGAGCLLPNVGSPMPYGYTNLQIIDDRHTLGDTTWVLHLPLKASSFAINAIPFRFRPAINNPNVPHTAVVSSQFSLALSYGPTYGFGDVTTRGITEWTVTPSVFFGSSSTGTTSPTAANTSAAANLEGSQNNFALSYGISGVFARNSVGIILAFGIDSDVSKNGGSWPYQNKPWFGIGVSTSILK